MLFELVSSLSKAEKRHFKIYAKRINHDGQVLFLDLFNYLEKQPFYDIQLLLDNVPFIKSKQLPNVKRSLYNHLLSSLSLLHGLKRSTLKIRTYMNYAELLYARGLYLQSLKILHRAKKIAVKSHNEEFHLEIIIQEQKIHSRHITRSTTAKMEALIKAADEKLLIKVNISRLSNLKLYLQRQFIIYGPDLTTDLTDKIQQKFESDISKYQLDLLSLFEKVYYYQCYYWIYYIKQDYEKSYQYALKWNTLFDDNPTMKENDFDLFLICKHHYLNMLFFTKRHSILAKNRNTFQQFANDKSLTLNSFILANHFQILVRADYVMTSSNFQENKSLASSITLFLKNYGNRMDTYKILIIHYKMASLFILNKKYENAIIHLNKIINSTNPLRVEIICYARILLLICHIELQDYEIVNYLAEKTKRFIQLSDQSNKFMKDVIDYLFKYLKTDLSERALLRKNYLETIVKITEQSKNNRSELFVDFIKLSESKKQKYSVYQQEQ